MLRWAVGRRETSVARIADWRSPDFEPAASRSRGVRPRPSPFSTADSGSARSGGAEQTPYGASGDQFRVCSGAAILLEAVEA
eukprot:11628760-Alexandrium_andersonii.AAC.1